MPWGDFGEHIGADAITYGKRRPHDARLATPWTDKGRLAILIRARHHITLKDLEIEFGLAVMAGLPDSEIAKLKQAISLLDSIDTSLPSNVRKRS